MAEKDSHGAHDLHTTGLHRHVDEMPEATAAH
jgi:hypothetical protein